VEQMVRVDEVGNMSAEITLKTLPEMEAFRQESLEKGLSLTSVLTRFEHKTDPFLLMSAALVGKPKATQIKCNHCQKVVRKAFVSPQMFGHQFTVLSCACTLYQHLSELPEPDQDLWQTKAKQMLKLSVVAQIVTTAVIPEDDIADLGTS
jgi:hypothetical protein